MQLPEGLPDEQLIEPFPVKVKSGLAAVNGCGERAFLSYLSDEGAFRMAIHVSRILTALVKSVSVSWKVSVTVAFSRLGDGCTQ